jgi:hypothetical protein
MMTIMDESSLESDLGDRYKLEVPLSPYCVSPSLKQPRLSEIT